MEKGQPPVSHGICIECYRSVTGKDPSKSPTYSGQMIIICAHCKKILYHPDKPKQQYRRNTSGSGSHQLPHFGPYIIHDEIARGGQGAVCRAIHRELGTPVAIKILLEPDHLGMKRFRQEAKVLARLDHPNILRVVDMGTANTAQGPMPYIAMEYIEGQDLKQLIKEGYRWRQAAKALIKVARALNYCHQMGIVHRDLKPANILIENETQRPVIVDFGLVKRDAGKMGMASLDRSRLSVTGELKGTPQYMAPEQLDVDEFGKEGSSVDIYALGGILYFLLTGRPVFQGTTAYNIMMKVMQDEAPDPRDINPEIPAGIAELTLMCLSKDPGDRPQDAEIFAEELEAALRPRSKPARRSRRQGKRWLAAGLVAGGMMAGGLSFREAQMQRKALRAAERMAYQEAELARTRKPRVVKPDPVASEGALFSAKEAFDRGDYGQAEIEATRAIQLQNTNTDAYLLLARVNFKRGNPQGSLSHMETALHILEEQEITDARYLEARTLQANLRDKVLEAGPESNRDRMEKSIRLYEQSGDMIIDALPPGVNTIDDVDIEIIERAKSLVDEAIEIWPINPMARVQRAKFNVQRGDRLETRVDIEIAIYIYEQAIRSGQMSADDRRIQEALQLRRMWFNRRKRLRRFS